MLTTTLEPGDRHFDEIVADYFSHPNALPPGTLSYGIDVEDGIAVLGNVNGALALYRVDAADAPARRIPFERWPKRYRPE